LSWPGLELTNTVKIAPSLRVHLIYSLEILLRVNDYGKK